MSRMQRLEALLAETPGDPELRYFLAMEHASAGDRMAAIALLKGLTDDSEYVPAFLQAGQMLGQVGQTDEACAALRRGVELARAQGNSHAAGEMQGFLDALE